MKNRLEHSLNQDRIKIPTNKAIRLPRVCVITVAVLIPIIDKASNNRWPDFPLQNICMA